MKHGLALLFGLSLGAQMLTSCALSKRSRGQDLPEFEEKSVSYWRERARKNAARSARAVKYARLSEKRALQIAKDSAIERGIDLSGYEKPEAQYSLGINDKHSIWGDTKNRWRVYFQRKPVNGLYIVGGYFFILVYDRTGETRFVGGM